MSRETPADPQVPDAENNQAKRVHTSSKSDGSIASVGLSPDMSSLQDIIQRITRLENEIRSNTAILTQIYGIVKHDSSPGSLNPTPVASAQAAPPPPACTSSLGMTRCNVTGQERVATASTMSKSQMYYPVTASFTKVITRTTSMSCAVTYMNDEVIAIGFQDGRIVCNRVEDIREPITQSVPAISDAIRGITRLDEHRAVVHGECNSAVHMDMIKGLYISQFNLNTSVCFAGYRVSDQTVMLSSEPRSVALWDCRNPAKAAQVFDSMRDLPHCMAAPSWDDTTIYVGNKDGYLYIGDTRMLKFKSRMNLKHTINALAVSKLRPPASRLTSVRDPDNTYIIAGRHTTEHPIVAIDMTSLVVRALGTHTALPLSIALPKCESWVASSDRDGNVYVAAGPMGPSFFRIDVRRAAIQLAISPSDNNLAVAGQSGVNVFRIQYD